MKSSLLKSFLLLTSIICISFSLSAQTDSAVWTNTTKTPTGYAPALDSLPLVGGSGSLISADIFKLNNIGVYSRVKPTATSSAPFDPTVYSAIYYAPNNVAASTTGTWTAAPDPTIYIEFKVKAKKANTYITSIKLPFASKGGANARADLYYSTDGFTTSTQIGVGSANTFKKDTFLLYPIANPNVLLKNVGDSFILRINPFFKTASTGKAFGFEDLVIYANATQIVPVTFEKVFVTKDNNLSKLNWSISNEVNTLNYTIESSVNGKDFTTVAVINANNAKNYSTSIYTNGFYRIKAIDKDGSFVYSSVINFTTITSREVSVYPNPVKGKLNIQLNAFKADNYKVSLISSLGQSVYSTVLAVDGTNFVKSIEIPSSIKTGVYQLVITNNTERIVKTISVQ